MHKEIFTHRYQSRTLWETFGETERRFLVQAFRILSEQLFPYRLGGNESEMAKDEWASIHDALSMELGLRELYPREFSFKTQYSGKEYTEQGIRSIFSVCEGFMCSEYEGSVSPDRFMKDRISFIELAFQRREEELRIINAKFPEVLEKAKKQDAAHTPGTLRSYYNMAEGVQEFNDALNEKFRITVNNLNHRLAQAGARLNYREGAIQLEETGSGTCGLGQRLVPALLVRDMQETLEFYQKLGFVLTKCHPDPANPTWAEVQRGSV